MEIDSSRIQELIRRPSESLSVELKQWIDIDQPEGIAKIVRTALSIRNYGGGYIVIGFNNDTMEPDTTIVPADVSSAFHIDKIQALISRFSSEPFEVVVEFPERDGQKYPVIVIPPGVKTPVASKSDLPIRGKMLITCNDIYVRSLNANNTPSTTKATWKDWPALIELCFDNREADIGRFLRRHLRGVTPELVAEFTSAITKDVRPEITTEERLREFMLESEDRYKRIVSERKIKSPEHGIWEVAFMLIGDIPQHSANVNFLNLLNSNNPEYTGWPVWLDSRGFSRIPNSRPYVFSGVWEAFLFDLSSGFFNHIDFMRLDPQGRFFLRRALEDDISGSERRPEPLTAFDFGLPIIRTAEAMAVGISFAKAMGCNAENTSLAFGIKWVKLRGRQLSSWAQPMRYWSSGGQAYQDDVTVFVTIPLNTPLSALSEYVNEAVRPLFEIFDGATVGKDVVEDLTRRLLERRL